MEKMLAAKINVTLNAGVAKAVVEEKILDTALSKKAPAAGIKIDRAIKLMSRALFKVDRSYTGYAYEQHRVWLAPYSRQLTTPISDGNSLINLNFINEIISKEMNHVVDDAAFGHSIRLGTIARLNRLVSRRVKLIPDVGRYFGINTLNAGEIYAADKDGLYRLPISGIKYERMFK